MAFGHFCRRRRHRNADRAAVAPSVHVGLHATRRWELNRFAAPS
jgi:hypothetical protein